MKKNALLMIIASVIDIAERFKTKGRIIIAHEHCLISHVKEQSDVDCTKIGHAHCMKH
jgi:hypothetical protein